MELPRHRLQKARLEAGYKTPTDAANALKAINKNTLISHENGNREISRKAAEKYAAAFGVSAGWILYGGPDGPLVEQAIPHISWVSAGVMAHEDIRDEAIGTIRVADLPPGDWIALTVTGDSMDRISPPDSIIFVNRRDKALVPNGLYVIDDGEGNATYKRFRPNPDRFEPVSTNPDHEPIFPDHEPTIVGRVRRSMINT